MNNIKKLSIQKAAVKQITRSNLSHLFDKPKDPNDVWISNNWYSLTKEKKNGKN